MQRYLPKPLPSGESNMTIEVWLNGSQDKQTQHDENSLNNFTAYVINAIQSDPHTPPPKKKAM